MTFSSPLASLEGASLAGIALRARPVASEAGSLELSLVGFGLTHARIQGPLDSDGRRLWIADLRGAVLDDTTCRAVDLSGAEVAGVDLRGAVIANTTFSAVDLSSADVTGVDLSGLRIDEDSLCPSGEPPVVESSFGTYE